MLMIMIFNVIRISSIEYVLGLCVVFTVLQNNNNKLTINH